VARLLERDDFAQRFAGGVPISVSELLYPFAQGYDSVAVQADVEVGGSDQLYNLLMGRDVMEHYGLEPQAVVTYELLVGTDGAAKMSKSEDNYVGIDDAPEEQFGKVMSIPDGALEQWWRLGLDAEAREAEPLESKLALARGIVSLYHGEEAATQAEEHFTRTVRRGEAPEQVPDVRLVDSERTHLPAFLVKYLGIPSTSEGRRLIAQGGVRINGEPVAQMDIPTASLDGALVQAGKRRYVRVRVE
jgi:tyrosyl-tRNA synthetase